MRIRRSSAVALACAAAVPLSGAATSAAATVTQPAAHLQGTFAIHGRITSALNVKGEHRGQLISRTWTFAPLCSSGSCGSVRLTRTREDGLIETATLHRTGPRSFRGSGSFYAPLRCANFTNRRGELVPFTITVKVTSTIVFDGVSYATEIDGTYSNRKRRDLTRCVAPPAHDAALYNGKLIV